MEFNSQSGNTYYYDNEIGIAFPSHPLMKKLISADSRHLAEIPEIGDNKADILFYSRFLEKLDKIRPRRREAKPRQPLKPEDIKPLLLREGLDQIILGVTEDCNLRCRYCIYSDAYSYSRNRTSKKMDLSTAKKALDYYVSLFLEGREYNPVRRPAVAFYGGEPLMNFELIKKCVLYLKSTYPELEFHFTFTTNGTLLTKEREDFFLEHGFYVNFSIDGPEEEHNRKRVYSGNKGSFSDVMKNAQRFMQTGRDKCSSFCVFDFKSNPFDLEAFFRRSDVPRLSMISMPERGDDCRYYDQFSKEDVAAFHTSLHEAFRTYLEKSASADSVPSFFDQMFPLSASRFLYSPSVLVSREQQVFPYAGACIPGKKIFVDCGGNFHACERINEYFPIGNVRTGLDFQKIATLMNQYNEHLDSCGSCSISKTCGKCYTSFVRDGSFEYASRTCNNEAALKQIEFSQAFTLGEICPDRLNSVVRDHYSWLSKISPTLGD